MNDKEKMNNLEPIPGEPGWFVNPETGEVFNENDPSNYEEGEDGNYGDEEDWDDENDPYGEDLENDDESDGQESGEGEPNDKEEKESEEGEGGEGGSARDALKNSQEGAKDTAKGAEKAAESATNAGAKGAASAAEGVAGAGGAAAGSGAAASGAAAGGSAAAGGAAAAGGTAAAPWIAGAIAVVIIVILLLLFFMALMGYGTDGLSSPQERAYGAPTGEVPLFKQGDPRWGNNSFACGGTTLRSSGCGPTSIAMIISYHLGRNIYPSEIAQKVLDNGWRVCNAGTAWAAMTEIPKMYGLQSKGVTWTQAKKYLEQGKPIIQSQRGPHFTNGGHIIVITGKMDGIYLINDPGGRNVTRATERQITEDIGSSWVVWK